MIIILWIYITGLIISLCVFYVAFKIIKNENKDIKVKINNKKLILGTIFYPITWVIIGLDVIADVLSE